MGIWGLRERRVRSVRKPCGGVGLLTESTFDCDTPSKVEPASFLSTGEEGDPHLLSHITKLTASQQWGRERTFVETAYIR